MSTPADRYRALVLRAGDQVVAAAARRGEADPIVLGATGWTAGVEIGLTMAALNREGAMQVLDWIQRDIQKGDPASITEAHHVALEVLGAFE